MVWSLNKIQDTTGNYITFTYNNSYALGQSLLQRIDYTGNANENMLPYNSVHFEYVESEQRSAFMSGAVMISDKILSYIETFAEGMLVTKYSLSYSLSPLNGRAFMTEVSQCSSEPEEGCYKTEFLWSENTPKFSDVLPGPVTHSDLPPIQSLDMTYLEKSRLKQGDFDGDGNLDWYIVRGYGGTAVDEIFLYKGSNNYERIDGISTHIRGWIAAAMVDIRGIMIIDLDNDGKSDVWVFSQKENKIHLSNGDGSYREIPGPEIRYDALSIGSQSLILQCIKFGDFNGDGRTDIYYIPVLSSVQQGMIFLGSANFSFPTMSGILHNIRPGVLAATDDVASYITVDLNADGKTDLYHLNDREASAGYSTDKMYISNGYGLYEELQGITRQTDPRSTDLMRSFQSRVNMADFNGDGVIDIYVINTPSQNSLDFIFLNEGNGSFFQINGIPSSICETHLECTSVGILSYHVQDANNDNIADIIKVDNSSQIYLSHGNQNYSFVAGPHFELSPVLIHKRRDLSFIFLTDTKGDNMLDFYISKPYDGQNDSIILNGGSPLQITGKVDNLGSRSDIVYLPTTNSVVYTPGPSSAFPAVGLNRPLYVVYQTKGDNGIGGKLTNTYHYTDGKFNLEGYGWLGFSSEQRYTDSLALYESTMYSQDYASYMHHRPIYGETFNLNSLGNKSVFSTFTNIWVSHKYCNGIGQLSFVVELALKNETYYGLFGELQKIKTSNYTYDSYDNIVTIWHSEYNSPENKTEVFTLNSYTEDLNAWILGIKTSTSIQQTKNGCYGPIRTTYYNFNTSTWLLDMEIQDVNSPDDSVTTEYVRDGFGNVIFSRRTGAGGEQSNVTTSFDSKGRFETSRTNALGQTQSGQYDPKFGSTTVATDPNGLSFYSFYDGFGRPYKQRRADGSETRYSFSWCNALNGSYSYACPHYAVYYTVESTPGNSDIIGFFDILHRRVCQATINRQGLLVFKSVSYDAAGRVIATSDPYIWNSANQLWTKYHYDLLSRQVMKIHVDNATTTIEYNGLTTLIINKLGQKILRETDASGKLIMTKDDLGIKTTYNYDAQGNLVAICDVKNNCITYEYDFIRNREVQMNHPDRGTWKYTYNAFDQMTAKYGPMGLFEYYTYDGIGRLVKTEYPEGNIWTIYDTYVIGKLAHEYSNTSKELFEKIYGYDQFGREMNTTVSYKGHSWTVTSQYDPFSRLSQIIYPSGFAVKYCFGNWGHLNSVRNPATGYVFYEVKEEDPYGRILQDALGNKIETFREYNINGYLSKILSYGEEEIQDLRYKMNSIGNVLERLDGILGQEDHIGYDSLNRIIKLDINGNKVRTLEYDELSNLVKKSDVGIYQYDGGESGGPHSVKRIIGPGGTEYMSYDDIGNNIEGASRKMTYYSFLRPKSVETTKHDPLSVTHSQVRMFYDCKHSLLERRDYAEIYYNNSNTTNLLSSSTIFLGNLFEYVTTSNGTTILRNYIGDYAVYEESSSGMTKLFYFHRDLLKSINVVTDEQGNVIKRINYDPFGNPDTWENVTIDYPGLSAHNTRGYAQHEMLDSFNLVHMNARLYDPHLFLFLSPDPVVQYKEFGYLLPPYSLVGNNPMARADPTGKGIIGDIIGGITGAVSDLVHSVTHFFQQAVHSIINSIQAVEKQVEQDIVNGAILNLAPLAVSLIPGCTGWCTAIVASSFQVFSEVAQGVPPSQIFVSSVIGLAQNYMALHVGWLNAPEKILISGAEGGIENMARGQPFETGFIEGAAPAMATTVGSYFSHLPSYGNAFRGEMDKFIGAAASGAITGAATGVISHQNVFRAALKGAAESGWDTMRPDIETWAKNTPLGKDISQAYSVARTDVLKLTSEITGNQVVRDMINFYNEGRHVYRQVMQLYADGKALVNSLKSASVEVQFSVSVEFSAFMYANTNGEYYGGVNAVATISADLYLVNGDAISRNIQAIASDLS